MSTTVRDPLNPAAPTTAPPVHKTASGLFPSTASKLDIIVLRQLLLKTTCASCAKQAQSVAGSLDQRSARTVHGSARAEAEVITRLDRIITSEALLDVLRPREFITPEMCMCCIPSRPMFESRNPLANDLAFVIKRLSDAFSPSNGNNGHETSFLCVLNASVEDTPMLSTSSLVKLSRLTTLPFVTQDAVRHVLRDEQFGVLCDHPQFRVIHDLKVDQILNCIFYTKQGAERVSWTTSDALMDVINTVQTKSLDRMRFGSTMAAYQVEARRSISSLAVYLCLLAVVAVAVVNLGIWKIFVVTSATAPTFNWMNYCTDGPTSTCYFNGRALGDISTHAEVLRFVQSELVSNLWSSVPDDTTAASAVPFGDAWYIGALLIRVAPSIGHRATSPRFSCSDMNLSVTYQLSAADESFSCGAQSFVSVPFDYTLPQATAAVAGFHVGAPTEDVTVVVGYSMYNPPTGAVVYNEAGMTLKQAGGVVVRARHYVASNRLVTTVLVCYIAYNIYFFFENAMYVVNALRGFGFHSSYLFVLVKVLNLGCINVAWSNVAGSESLDHWAQASYQPLGLDELAFRDTIVQYSFGVWVLVVVALSSTYLSHVQVVRLVVQLVQAAFAPLIATTIVMLCCFVGFVNLAMLIFGTSQVEFSSFVNTFRVMFPFLIGAGDSSIFTKEMYIVGTVFYGVFAILTNFVALNIFNGVMMAPLGDLISTTGSLWRDLCQSVMQRAKRRHFSWWVRRSLASRLVALPWLNFLVDALPIPEMHWSVLHRFLNPKSNYHYLVNASRQLYEMQDFVNNDIEARLAALPVAERSGPDARRLCDWRTSSLLHRCLKMNHKYFGITDTTVTLVQLIIMFESRWDVLRDARLGKVVGLWEEDQAKLQKEFATVDGWTSDFMEVAEDEADAEMSTNADQPDLNVYRTVDLRSDSEDDEDALVLAADGALELQTVESFNQLAQSQTDGVDAMHFVLVDHIKKTLLGTLVESPLLTLLLKALHLILVLTAYIVLVNVYGVWSIDTASLNADLHAGMRDATYRQFCSDAQCTSGNTYVTSFANGGQFSDLQGFMERVLQPSIFAVREGGAEPLYPLNESLPIAGINTSAVRWSPSPRFYRLIIRHLRGVGVGCELPFSVPSGMPPSEAARVATFQRLTCYSGSNFLQGPLPVPTDNVLSSDAYVYQDGCSDGWQHNTNGYQYSYPCAGYSTQIETTEQLLYAANNWLADPSVRFVALTFEFYHNVSLGNDPPMHTTYDMYVQVGMGGGQAAFWVSTTQRNLDTISIAQTTIVLLHAHGSLIVTTVLYYGIWVYRGNFVFAYRAVRYEKPVFSLLLTALGVSIFYADFPSSDWASVMCCCIATVLFTVKLISCVVIPLTGLISRRATTFPRMLSFMLGRVIVVIPFFVTFLVAFGLSGYVLWGSSLQEYATINQSFNTVLQGLIGGWDFASLDSVFPGLAIAVTSVFFIIIPVVLLPTLLSLIVQCAEDANDELAVTNEVVALAERMGSWVYFGPLASYALALWVSAHEMLQREHARPWENRIARLWARVVVKLMGQRRASGKTRRSMNPEDNDLGGTINGDSLLADDDDDAAALLDGHQRLRMYEAWRLPSAVDCLQPYLGAPRITHLLRLFRFHSLCPTMQYTAVAYIIIEVSTFRRRQEALFKAEAELERETMRSVAKSAMTVLDAAGV